jgi:hypothetical protein
MLNDKEVEKLSQSGRRIVAARTGDKHLGPFKQLPGTWRSLPGHGWNMIALPFADGPSHYRLLCNQYNEDLKFSIVDKGVPNRGISQSTPTVQTDQFVVTLGYVQNIEQIAAEDFPHSGEAGGPGLAIHHEPGLFLNMTNETTNDITIARLATIPHGDSVLGLGTSSEHSGAPKIPKLNGLPIGVSHNLRNRYLAPYKHFRDNPFRNVFDPTEPNDLLDAANQGVDIVKTTKLEFDTACESGGISNIPFVVKQANAAEMKSTFWIQELASKDEKGRPELRLQYSQVVLLDFFGRPDGFPGKIRWPHVSINTLVKV